MKLVRHGIYAFIGLMAISFASFFLIVMMPSDPVEIAIRAWHLSADAQTIAAMRADWGLDRPLIARYFHWLSNFMSGDWGRSFRTGEPVLEEFRDRLPLTLALGASGMCLAIIIAVPFGYLAATRPGGMADTASRVLSIFVQSVPGFWLGLVLLWVLGVELRWIRPFANDWTAVILPIGLIALHSLAVFTRVYRRDMEETKNRAYFKTALAKGLSHKGALWRHGHGSATYALLSSVRSEAGWIIGSTATMEILFNLNGISQFLVQSIAARDQMVLQAYVMVVAIWMVIVNTTALIAMRCLDPRIIQ